MPKRWTDVTGQRFGRLMVLHCKFPTPKRALVQCDCGVEFSVGIPSLLSGSTRSCGATLCSTRAFDLTEQRFGSLTVKRLFELKNTRGELLWECKCDCGMTKIVKTSHLMKGGVKSCGCQTSKLMSRAHRRLGPKERFIKSVMTAYQNSAKQRNLDLTITLDELEKLVFLPCHYCGLASSNTFRIEYVDGEEIFRWNGIDRLDSKRGYNVDNCVPCCKMCNRAKSNLTLLEFQNWVNRLIDHSDKSDTIQSLL